MEDKVYVLAIVQDVPQEQWRDYVSPMQTRRYGLLMKRALVTAIKCMRDSGVSKPDAIINGTALGSIEESERILQAMASEGEDVSMPTQFMLSTHNAVASILAITTKCHGYNCTYSQGRWSFEQAMLDAFIQIKSGDIKTALVTANDYITPSCRQLMEKAGMTVGDWLDRSIAVMLSSEDNGNAVGELLGVSLKHSKEHGDEAKINIEGIDGSWLL